MKTSIRFSNDCEVESSESVVSTDSVKVSSTSSGTEVPTVVELVETTATTHRFRQNL